MCSYTNGLGRMEICETSFLIYLPKGEERSQGVNNIYFFNTILRKHKHKRSLSGYSSKKFQINFEATTRVTEPFLRISRQGRKTKTVLQIQSWRL